MKKLLITVAVVLFIILSIVTDLTLYLLIAVGIALITWLIGKVWGYTTRQAILTISFAMVVLPMMLIFIIGAFGILQEPESAKVITSSTTEAIVNYFVRKLPYIILSDLAGITAGAIIGAFKR